MIHELFSVCGLDKGTIIHGHMIRFDFIQHLLDAGTIKVRSAVSVINKENRIRKSPFSCICLEDAFLIAYGIRLSIQSVLLGKTAVECGDFISCPYKAWKSTQAPLDLPTESCTEEEKLAWMREHYSSELGPYELVDAIESMHDLGLMDRYEWNSVYGRSLTIITDVQSIPIIDENGEERYIITDQRLLGIREVPPNEPPWGFDDHFDRAPLHKLHTLEDLENWLKEFRTQPVADWEVKRRELMARNGITEHFFVEV